MPNFSESVQEQSQILGHFQSYPRTIPAPALRTNDTSSSSSLSGQLLLTPPFVVGSSPPPAATSTATSTYGALGQDHPSSKFMRERSAAPTSTQSSTSARTRQQPLSSNCGCKQKEISGTSNEDFGQEGSIEKETSSQGQMDMPLEMHDSLEPQTLVYPRLPSSSYFLLQPPPLPIVSTQSSASQSIEDEEFISGASTSETSINNEHHNNNMEVRRGRWQLDLTSNCMYTGTGSPSMVSATAPNAEYSPLNTVLETSLPPTLIDPTQSALPTSQLLEGQVSTETVDQFVQTNEGTTIEAAAKKVPAKKGKMYRCDICKKSFPRPSGLIAHRNLHLGARRKFYTKALSSILLLTFYLFFP